MDVSTTLGLASVILLVVANGFFVATEFAIVAVRRSRLEQLAAEGVANARAGQEVVKHLDTYIAACQLGITMASLALGWVGEPALAHLIEPPMEALVGQFAPAAAHGVAVGVSFAIITALHIVIGELAPKGLALQRPEGTTLWIARPIQFFEFIFRWPIALLNGIGNGVLRLAGLHPAAGHEMVHTVEELRLLVNATRQAGMVEESEARIASRAFTFADLNAGALITPRTELEAIPVTIGLDELRKRIASSQHTRLPVYEDSVDNIIGVLYVLDFYQALEEFQQNMPDGQTSAPLDLRSLITPPMVVPESKPADDLLEEMRTLGRYFATVIDEYGGTAGIVTFDDLMEALVGPMRAEERRRPGGAVIPVVPSTPEVQDGALVLDGLMRLEELEELVGIRLDGADHEAVETIGGLIMTRLGRIPEVGDEVLIGGRTLRVEALDGMRVAQIRVLSLLGEPQPQNQSGSA